MLDDNQERLHTQRELYYDFFKWLTTLSLIAIGGVFSLITQAQFSFRPFELLFIVGALGIAALTGLSGAKMQVDRSNPDPRLDVRSIHLIRLVMFALGLGAGGFVMIFANKLLG